MVVPIKVALVVLEILILIKVFQKFKFYIVGNGKLNILIIWKQVSGRVKWCEIGGISITYIHVRSRSL